MVCEKQPNDFSIFLFSKQEIMVLGDCFFSVFCYNNTGNPVREVLLRMLNQFNQTQSIAITSKNGRKVTVWNRNFNHVDIRTVRKALRQNRSPEEVAPILLKRILSQLSKYRKDKNAFVASDRELIDEFGEETFDIAYAKLSFDNVTLRQRALAVRAVKRK